MSTLRAWLFTTSRCKTPCKAAFGTAVVPATFWTVMGATAPIGLGLRCTCVGDCVAFSPLSLSSRGKRIYPIHDRNVMKKSVRYFISGFVLFGLAILTRQVAARSAFLFSTGLRSMSQRLLGPRWYFSIDAHHTHPAKFNFARCRSQRLGSTSRKRGCHLS